MKPTLIIRRPISTLLLSILAGILFALGFDPYTDLTDDGLVYLFASLLMAGLAACAALDLL